MNYKKTNNLIGWLVFGIASLVFIMTAEPTASFWDCGEYIATAYKLQVGHPPGAPLFQMIGRFFTLFAFGDTSLVAYAMNIMSALASGFAVLFLFWIITYLARKIFINYYKTEIGTAEKIMIFGSGVVGALAFTFADSFWFSAVEGEVYALSAFFTAVVLWAIVRWEQNADDIYSYRWLILIAYLMGLSIGVHLLNLLAIPAITMVYYFRKYKPTTKGTVTALGISIILIFVIMYMIVPGVVKFAGIFERLFINSFDLPFNSGTIFYFLLIAGLIFYGLHYTRKKKKVAANTAILALMFVLIGYSSFAMLVIRSNADTPIDENNPESALSLLSYLNREQYGSWPIVYGRYYNAPRAEEAKDGVPMYERFYIVKDGDRQVKKFMKKRDAESFMKESGKDYDLDHEYRVVHDAEGEKPTYKDEFKTLFPRMWSNSQQKHEKGYKKWSGFNGNNGIPVTYQTPRGKQKTRHKPKFFKHNLKFFFSYQVGHMYLRYFLWNFAGRQNDIQGHGNPLRGNWISGIPFIDNMRGNVAPMENLPQNLKQNKAHNTFYLLPLLLGIIGFFYHLNVDKRNTFFVFMIFIMTGLAIVVYLNQYPYQPRERDYAYAGSLFAFAVWIGLGVMSLTRLLSKVIPKKVSAILVSVVALLAVPGIMASEGWDDHDRSDRYTARDIAKNYLNSCKENAILFTFGDNDTFPLWYVQEVEGVRTDVRVVNLSLLNTGWYADQMSRKAYESDPVPFSMDHDQYRTGTRDYVFVYKENLDQDKHYELDEIIDFVGSDNKDTKLQTRNGARNYFPTNKFKITVDSAKVVENDVVRPEDRDKIVDEIKWKVGGRGIMKNRMLQLDFIANNDWERPVYFAITTGSKAYANLEDYFQLEGLAYRLVPVKDTSNDGMTGRVATDIMYDNMMNEFEWGNMGKEGVFLDETNRRMTMNFRSNFGRLANALVKEGKDKKAEKVCDKCLDVIPDSKIPYDYFVIPIAEAYYKIDKTEKGDEITKRLLEIYDNDLNYYFNLKPKHKKAVSRKIDMGMRVLKQLSRMLKQYNRDDLVDEAEANFEKYYQDYVQYKRSSQGRPQRQRRIQQQQQQQSQGLQQQGQ